VKFLVLILFLAALALLLPANAQTTEKEWQAKAMEKYPALGIEGSEFNKRFVAAYNQRRASNPQYFTNPRWPMSLADELAIPPKPGLEIPQLPADGPAPGAPKSADAGSDSGFPHLNLILAIAASILGVFLLIPVVKVIRRRLLRARLIRDARKYVQLLKERNALPSVSCPLLLKADETAYYSAPATLYETREVQMDHSGSVSFRMAKGVNLSRAKGRAISLQQWTILDTGRLTITNKRLVFDGSSAGRAVPLANILSAEASLDSVEVAVEYREKSMLFDAHNPIILSLIIHICCQAPDPDDLSNTPLDIRF
jgi:hypothetical protein